MARPSGDRHGQARRTPLVATALTLLLVASSHAPASNAQSATATNGADALPGLQSAATTSPGLATTPPGPAAASDATRFRVLLAPSQDTTLSSRMEGTLEELPVSLGDSVAEGDLLARLDCRIEQARINVANTELSMARLNNEAKQNLRRLDAVGDLEVALARAEVEKAQSALNLAAAQRDRCAVSAPFAGRIARVHVKPFQTLAAGTPLVDLVGDGVLKVRLNAPSRLLPSLAVGQALEVSVNETGQRYAATLSAINARVDAVAQTVELEARLEAAHDELSPGMTGTAILIPASGAATGSATGSETGAVTDTETEAAEASP
ncbi:efflux RND transporter periplasmic adaptor subunit [Halomonas sp. V046]|uniref:efflux RND transporter periplasmic adaptor subunit n=1 Tax=Halomonas sp. V046 TaxID=3459611 RepID=UPI004043FD42